MWQSRQTTIKKRSRIVLDKRFPAALSMNLGDTGQALVDGVIDAERLEFQEDDVERIIKTVRIVNVKKLENRLPRVS